MANKTETRVAVVSIERQIHRQGVGGVSVKLAEYKNLMSKNAFGH